MKKSKENFLIIGGIIVFVLTVFIQMQISRHSGNTAINGVIMQIQVLVSVLLTVFTSKKGLITSTVLNVVNCLYTLIFVIIIMNNFASVPAVVAPLITIITCCIIYMYSARVAKANAEVKTAYDELVETTKIIREKDEKLIYLAYYDILTGLANRQLFVEQIDEMINTDANAPFTVIIADIDDFKRVINMYGHNIGDILISTYAERLRGYCGKNDFIAKFGEEEFAIIVKGTSDDAELIEYVENLRIALCAPVLVNDNPIQLTMSFGVSEYPASGTNSGEILRTTDIAVTNSKMSGRGRIFFLNQQKCI